MSLPSRLKQYFKLSWQSFTQDLQLMREAPVSAEELKQTFLLASLPTLNFYLLLSLAAAISTFGLLTNSAATIIGAMIIAPLMNPIAALAYALVVLRSRLFARAIFTLLTGTILVIAIGYCTTELLGLKVVGSEILGRTQPNSLDLGVAVAAGTAAAFANTRRSVASALAGVAIAVALVPPLSVVGIGLCLGELGTTLAATRGIETNIAAGSFLLFATNLVGIVFSGSLVFLWQGYGNLKKAVIGLIASVLGLFILLQPLKFSLKKLYIESVANYTLFQLRQENSPIFSSASKFRSLSIQYGENDLVHINLDIEIPLEDMDRIQERVDTVSVEIDKAVNQAVGVDVDLVVDVVPFQRIRKQPF